MNEYLEKWVRATDSSDSCYERRWCDVPVPLQSGFQKQAERESSSGIPSFPSALSLHSADTCKVFWCGVKMEYHNTDIRLIGQDELLSVWVGIKPNPLLFPSLLFLLKYSTRLMASRKAKIKNYCADECGGRSEGKNICQEVGLICIKKWSW